MKRIALLLMFLLMGLNQQAEAHRFAPSLLRLFEVGEGQYNVVWKTPAQKASNVPLLPVFPPACSVDGLDQGALEGTGVVTSWTLLCPEGLLGREIGVTGLLENQASVLFSLETRDGYFYQTLLNDSQPSFEVPAEPTVGEVIVDYMWLGMEHIWGGIDHLLFVFGLLLLVGWGRMLIWTITSFTVGHSVALSLVTLGFFDYNVALVEFTIAVSILVLAVELARRDGAGMFRLYPWALAGGFGLLHGMGFAGALAEVGLPQSEVPMALLFFNMGIELGQLAFIFVIVGLWFSVRRFVRDHEGSLLPVPVYVLGSLSAMWSIERALEMF